MEDLVILPTMSFPAEDGLFEAAVEPLTPKAWMRKPKRDTKTTGDISEARVLAAFVEAGYMVARPFGENQRYDLVIDDGDILSRVQVKTGRLRAGVIMFNCCSTHGHRRSEAKTRPYTGQIELLAVFCPDTQKVYVVPEWDLTRSKLQLRVVPARNNQLKTIRWAAQYELA